MQELSQLSSIMPVELNEQPNLPSLRTVRKQWWIQSPELLTSTNTAKLISDFEKTPFSLSEDKAQLIVFQLPGLILLLSYRCQLKLPLPYRKAYSRNSR